MTDGGVQASRPPGPPSGPVGEPGGNSKWRHPLTLATIPALAAVLAAVVALLPKCDSDQPSAATTPGTVSQSGVAFRVDEGGLGPPDAWMLAFDGPLPPLTGAPENRDARDWYSWATTRGAVVVQSGTLRLLMDNQGSDRVNIRSIRARIVDRLPPIDQTLITAPAAGAEPLTTIAFDLDKGDSVDGVEVESPLYGGPPPSHPPYFAENNITLNPGETEELNIIPYTGSCYCRFLLEIEIVDTKSTQTLEIGDRSGRPFELTADHGHFRAEHILGHLQCGMGEPLLYEGFATSVDGRVLHEADCSKPIR